MKWIIPPFTTMKMKKNGIAPKITGKAKNAVQEQVNATFISTVAEAVMKAGNALSVVNAGGQTSVEESLDTMQAQLQDYVVMLQSFQSIMTSAEMIMETSQNMLPDMDNIFGEWTKYHDRYADHDQFQRRCG